MNWREGLHLVPAHMRSAVERWIDHGIEGGSFLTALMSNDFEELMARGDDINLSALRDWARFLYSHAPSGCHGSALMVAEWRGHRGLSGLK